MPLMGPNSGTGHTLLVIAIENTVNFALRMIKPILDGKASSVEVKREAEEAYAQTLQNGLRSTVWDQGGCSNWYIKKKEDTGERWNGMMYPFWQSYSWYRSVFPTWKDWNLNKRHEGNSVGAR